MICEWFTIIELDDGNILQESPIFDGKNHGFRLRFSLKPIQWYSSMWCTLFYSSVVRERFGANGIGKKWWYEVHIPHGEPRSYLEFPNHMIVHPFKQGDIMCIYIYYILYIIYYIYILHILYILYYIYIIYYILYIIYYIYYIYYIYILYILYI